MSSVSAVVQPEPHVVELDAALDSPQRAVRLSRKFSVPKTLYREPYLLKILPERSQGAISAP